MRRNYILLGMVALLCFPVLAYADDPGQNAYDRKDYKAAIGYWKPLATKGDIDAQVQLGNMYFNGEGVPQDGAKAAAWFRMAALQGDVEAQIFLGDMYRDGDGVTQDKAEAAIWYDKAAKLGNAGAQYQLNQLSPDKCKRLSPNENYVKGYKSTIFANAVTGRDINKVKLMLACHADINSVDQDGYYPIHLAATQSTAGMVDVLLSHGAKVNERNAKTGETPLHVAVTYNDVSIVETLLRHGADKSLVNTNGQTPAQIATNPAILKLLE